MSNSASPKPIEKYEALKKVIVKIRIDTGINMNKLLGEELYPGRPNPGKDFATTCGTTPSASTKHFTEIQWQTIETMIYHVGPQYIELFYHQFLKDTYGIHAIDVMKDIDIGEGVPGDIRGLADRAILESSDVLRTAIEILADKCIDEDEARRFLDECDEAMKALATAKLKMIDLIGEE